MKNKKIIIKIFSLITLFAFSTSFVFAQIVNSTELSQRLEAIITKKNAVKKYIRTKESNALVVKGAQEYLVKANYLNATKSNGKPSIDGSFGRMTKQAIMDFQKDKGLSQDGIIGPKTAAALKVAMSQNQSVASIPEKVRSEVESVGAVQDAFSPQYDRAGLSFGGAKVNNDGEPALYPSRSNIQNPLSKIQGSLNSDRPGSSLAQDIASGNPNIDGGTPAEKPDPFVNQGTWEQVANAARRSFAEYKNKIVEGIKSAFSSEDSKDSKTDYASLTHEQKLDVFKKELEDTGFSKENVDNIMNKARQNCSDGVDAGCFEQAQIDYMNDKANNLSQDQLAEIDENLSKMSAEELLKKSQACASGDIVACTKVSDGGPVQTASIEPEPGDSTGSGEDKENEDIEKQGGKITRKVVFACECDAKGQNCKNLEKKVTFVEVRSESNKNTNKFFTENTISAKQGDDYLIEKEKLQKKGKEGSYYSQCAEADQNDVKEKKASKVGELVGQKGGDREYFTKDDDDAILFSDTNTTAATEAATEALPAAKAE